MSEQSNNKEEGSPDIAHMQYKKPVVIILLGFIVLCFFLLFYFHGTPENKTDSKPMEETFSLANNSPPVKENETSIKTEPTTSTNSQPDPALLQQQMALLQEKQKALQERLSAPLMLVNNKPLEKNSALISNAKLTTTDPNTQFLQTVSMQQPDTVQATAIGQLNSVITQGNFIHAILETAINSDLPGMLRAIVSEPVYADDGSQLLIPPGSRLIGQYKSGLQQGQSRIFVVWTRLITPTGISLNLGSPGTDNLGVAGFNTDSIDRHFWQRFGTAILLSMIGASTENIGVDANDPYNAAQAYRIAMADSLAQSANQSLQQTGLIPPTLTVNQGKPIMVFVAHDLHFENSIKQTKPMINIF